MSGTVIASSCNLHLEVTWYLVLATPHSPNSSQSYSLFDALRESIYSEVATLIANNESRPHFLVSVRMYWHKYSVHSWQLPTYVRILSCVCTYIHACMYVLYVHRFYVIFVYQWEACPVCTLYCMQRLSCFESCSFWPLTTWGRGHFTEYKTWWPASWPRRAWRRKLLGIILWYVSIRQALYYTVTVWLGV